MPRDRHKLSVRLLPFMDECPESKLASMIFEVDGGAVPSADASVAVAEGGVGAPSPALAPLVVSADTLEPIAYGQHIVGMPPGISPASAPQHYTAYGAAGVAPHGVRHDVPGGLQHGAPLAPHDAAAARGYYYTGGGAVLEPPPGAPLAYPSPWGRPAGCAGEAEDEEEERKVVLDRRRYERNAREQKRSHKITDQINALRHMLQLSGVQVKGNKYSILSTAAEYIQKLEMRNRQLEDSNCRDAAAAAAAAGGGGGMPWPSVKPEMAPPAVAPGRDASRSRSPRGGEPRRPPSRGGGEACEGGADERGGAGERYGGGDDDGDGSPGSPPSDDVAAEPSVVSNDDESAINAGGRWAPDIDYRSVFADASVAMAITSVDGRVIDCNRRFEEQSGYEREELVKLTVFNLITAEELQHTFSMVARMLHGTSNEKPPPYSARAVLKHTRPEDKPLFLSLSLVHDYAHRPRYFTLALNESVAPQQ